MAGSASGSNSSTVPPPSIAIVCAVRWGSHRPSPRRARFQSSARARSGRNSRLSLRRSVWTRLDPSARTCRWAASSRCRLSSSHPLERTCRAGPGSAATRSQASPSISARRERRLAGRRRRGQFVAEAPVGLQRARRPGRDPFGPAQVLQDQHRNDGVGGDQPGQEGPRAQQPVGRDLVAQRLDGVGDVLVAKLGEHGLPPYERQHAPHRDRPAAGREAVGGHLPLEQPGHLTAEAGHGNALRAGRCCHPSAAPGARRR